MKQVLQRKNIDCFFLLWHISVYVLVFLESRLIDIAFVFWPLRVLLYALTIVVGLIYAYRHRDYYRESKWGFIGLIALDVLLLGNIFLKGGSILSVLLVSFVAMSKGKSLDKIFRNTMIDLCVASAVVVVRCFVGLLPDEVDVRHVGGFFGGEYVRHSVGFLVHNQIPIAFWSVMLLYIAYKRERISVKMLLGFAVLNVVIFYFFGSRIVFGLGCALLLVYCLVRVLNHRFDTAWCRWAYPIGWLAYPVCAVFSWTMVLTYTRSNGFLVWFDLIFNNRFRQGQEAFKKYGISLLGHGSDAGLYTADTFTVDNGYIFTVIQQGLLLFLLLLVGYTVLVTITKRKDNMYLLLVLGFLAIESIINAHLFVFKLLPFYCILVNRDDPMLQKRASNPLLQPSTVNKMVVFFRGSKHKG